MGRLRGFNEYMEYERGFHGWLKFFFVTASIGAVLQVYFLVMAGWGVWLAISDDYAPLALATTFAQTGVIAVLLVAQLYGLWLFVHEDRRTPSFWSTFLLVSVLGDLLLSLIAAYQLSTMQHTTVKVEFRPLLETNVLRSFAISLVWALYWIRSVAFATLTVMPAFACRLSMQNPPSRCLTHAEADKRSNEARCARVLYGSLAA